MENKEYRDIYEAICRKAALNAQRIGTDLREFPGRMDGRYFDVDRNTLRPVEHIFCWTPSFFTGMALMAAQHTGNLSLVRWVEACTRNIGQKSLILRQIRCMIWDLCIRCTVRWHIV